jgi:uncharacterized protein involved in exopolysaccharide biosynthesis
VAAFTVSSLDEKINTLKSRLASSEADYLREKAGLSAKLAQLQAIRAQITPEMMALLTQLNTALGQ